MTFEGAHVVEQKTQSSLRLVHSQMSQNSHRVKTGYQELGQGLPQGCQEPSQLSHHWCLSGVDYPNPGTLILGTDVLTGIFTTRPNACPKANTLENLSKPFMLFVL